MGYEDPPLVKAHAVRLKMKLVENWMPLKEVPLKEVLALTPCKIGKQRTRRKEKLESLESKTERNLWKNFYYYSMNDSV